MVANADTTDLAREMEDLKARRPARGIAARGGCSPRCGAAARLGIMTIQPVRLALRRFPVGRRGAQLPDHDQRTADELGARRARCPRGRDRATLLAKSARVRAVTWRTKRWREARTRRWAAHERVRSRKPSRQPEARAQRRLSEAGVEAGGPSALLVHPGRAATTPTGGQDRQRFTRAASEEGTPKPAGAESGGRRRRPSPELRGGASDKKGDEARHLFRQSGERSPPVRQ